MLSYQHAYHAGSAADVLKHTLWAHLITQLTQKPAALHVYETHAGRGLYPLHGQEVQKLKEFQTGLARVYNPAIPQTLPAENPYLLTVAAHNGHGPLSLIPGSPGVAAHLLREQDHLYLAEAHPGEFEHLKTGIHRANLHLHLADGHGTIPKFIRRGQRTLVLIDPSYEVKTEYEQTVETVHTILAINPQATIMVWYPLLPTKPHRMLVEGLKQLAVSATWLAEFAWRIPNPPGAHGTGNIILNMPYGLEKSATVSLKTVAPQLANPTSKLTTVFLNPRR
ncbi:MAG: 23S rRNA (adenine(2030)-N(6))-methyltransferase RlmJ [Proteobacteria bacterium]|nr:23S rRNA (adenine(2030)-N(6))-methyltransferase RlmJ [Pseudomonadota bacterium]